MRHTDVALQPLADMVNCGARGRRSPRRAAVGVFVRQCHAVLLAAHRLLERTGAVAARSSAARLA